MREKDVNFEMRFYESLLEKKPDFVDALFALGDLYTKKELYQKALEVDQRLSVLRPENPTTHYNLACTYSLMNQIEHAFKAIQVAFESGYDDFPFLEHDKDLFNLRKDDRFQRLFDEIKKKKQT